jgi:hypothetical protein
MRLLSGSDIESFVPWVKRHLAIKWIRLIRQHLSRRFRLSFEREHRYSLECRSHRGDFHPSFAGVQIPTGSARVVEVFQPAQVLSFPSPLFLSLSLSRAGSCRADGRSGISARDRYKTFNGFETHSSTAVAVPRLFASFALPPLPRYRPSPSPVIPSTTCVAHANFRRTKSIMERPFL